MMQDDHMSFGGLGYFSASGGPGEDLSSEAQTPPDQANSSSSSVAGDMLKNLMRQCFAYHEEQQQRIPTSQDKPSVGLPNSNRPTPSSENEKNDNYELGTDTATMQQQPRAESRNVFQDIEAGRSRAISILEKFQQLSQRHGGGGGVGEITTTGAGTTASDIIIAPSVYKTKRDNFFEQENKRKREFLIKNFDYVAKRDRERYHQQMAQLDEAKQWENAVQDQYRQALEQRKKRLLGGNKKTCNNNNSLSSKAGIGSTKRKKVEKEKVKGGHHPSSHSGAQQDSSVAIYLSGLPADGSITADLLSTLFSSYGTIRKIHFYRHKESGELKGDGLVIYQIGTKSNEKGQLLQNVCSQMNGAELPCGAILKVEPADSSYQQQQQESSALSHTLQSHKQDTGETINLPSKENKEDKDDDSTGDLDDFFESLE